MESREQVDHYYGSPLFAGSAHPDARAPVEDEVVDLRWCVECFAYTADAPDSDECDHCGTGRA